MNPGTSALNPYAESYIPLSRRGTPDRDSDFNSSGNDTRGATEAITMGTCHWAPRVQAPQSYNVHGADAFYSAENSEQKGHAVQGFQSSPSHNPSETENGVLDEEFEMDLAYLQMAFPCVSDESLSDVYFANKGDLDATVDMLNHLECCSVDSSEKLPDTLDIGDVPESGGGIDLAPQETNLNNEASASSSGVSGLAADI